MGKSCCCCNSQRLKIVQSFLPPEETAKITYEIGKGTETLCLNEENFNYSLYQTCPTDQGELLLEWTFQIQLDLTEGDFEKIEFNVTEGIPLNKLPNKFLPSGFLTVGVGNLSRYIGSDVESVPLTFSFVEDPKESGNFFLRGVVTDGNPNLNRLAPGNIWGHVKYVVKSQRLKVVHSFVPPDGTVILMDQTESPIILNQENFNYSLYQTCPTDQGDHLLEWTFQIKQGLAIDFKSIQFNAPEGIPLHKLPNKFLPSGFLTVGVGSIEGSVLIPFGSTESVPLTFSFVEDPKGSGNFFLRGTLPEGYSINLLLCDIWGHVEYII